MPAKGKRRRSFPCAGGALLAICLLGAAPPSASAAGPPILGDIWSSHVDARAAVLSAEIDPNGLSTSGYFESVV